MQRSIVPSATIPAVQLVDPSPAKQIMISLDKFEVHMRALDVVTQMSDDKAFFFTAKFGIRKSLTRRPEPP